MKKLLYILLFVPLALFGQSVTPDMFSQPANTGAGMTIGVNASELDQFSGGQIGGFYDLDGDGTLECVALETISSGFFGVLIRGDDSSTPEKDGLSVNEWPSFYVLYEGTIISVNLEVGQCALAGDNCGYMTNGIVSVLSAVVCPNFNYWSDCPCVYEPVCGLFGWDYGNSCEAGENYYYYPNDFYECNIDSTTNIYQNNDYFTYVYYPGDIACSDPIACNYNNKLDLQSQK